MDNPKEMADPKSTIKIEKNDDEETTADCNTASNIDVAQSDVKIEESSLKVKKESPTQESSQIDYSQASSSQMVTHTDKKETLGARKHALSDEPRTSTDSGDNTAPPKPKRQKMTEPIDPYEHDMEIVLEPCSNVMHIDKDLPSEGYTEHPDCSRGSTSSRVTGNSVSGNDANGEDHDGQNGNAQNPHEHGGQGDQPADDNQDEDDSEEEDDEQEEEDDNVDDDDDDDDDDNDDDDEEDESEDDDTDTDGEGAGDQNPPVQSVEQVAADEASYVEVGAGDGAKNVPEESTVAKGEGGHIGDTKLPQKDDDVGQDADEPNDDLDADIFQQQAQPVEVEAVVHAEEQNNANQDGNNGDVGLNNENQGQNNEGQNNEGQNNEGHAEEQNNANQDGFNGDVGLNNENQGQNNEDQNNEDQNEQNNDEPEIIAEFIDMGGAGDAGINQLIGDNQEDPEEEQDEVDSTDEEMGEFHMVDDAGDAPADLAIDAPEAEEDDVMGPDPLLMGPDQDFPLMDPEPPVMVPDPHIPLMNPYPAYPEPPLIGLPHEADDNDSFDWNDSSDDEEETDDEEEEEEEDEPHQVGEHGEPGDGPPPPNMGGDPEADGGANAPEQGGGANPPAQDPPVDPASVGGGIGAGDAPLADDAHQLDSTMNESNSSHLDHVKNAAINYESAAKQNNTNRKDINCISEDKNLDQVSPLDSEMLNPELKINNPANKQSTESITEQSSQSAALKADDNGEDLRQPIVNLEKPQSPLAERSSVSLATCELCGPTQQCLRLRRNSVTGRVTRRGRGRPRSNENVSTENASYTCLLRRKVMQDRESGRKHVQTSYALKEHKTHDKCASDEITE
ncbi:uncharacterized protein DDB_G0290685-like [Nilaparvata lugens]|uniref:uncharacterized protein DDB_G0290685-like n=1 Tax=Nilaparvata lugens TaxID=108931 RepID=UPI00193E8547|nr:uncharacterized protein DDB_G0290685-like [Nilaparvata lugens]